MKNFLEESIENIDNDIIDFVDSKYFTTLNKILKNLYISQMIIGSTDTDPILIATNNSISKTFLNLCPDLENEKARILEERKRKSQEIEKD